MQSNFDSSIQNKNCIFIFETDGVRVNLNILFFYHRHQTIQRSQNPMQEDKWGRARQGSLHAKKAAAAGAAAVPGFSLKKMGSEQLFPAVTCDCQKQKKKGSQVETDYRCARQVAVQAFDLMGVYVHPSKHGFHISTSLLSES
jgi:hypothetical protein